MDNKLVRIGVFYDGNYFFRASSYYAYGHSRKTRLSVSGLHDFIRHHIAAETKSEVRLCHIVDAHYFRGRLNAYEASQRGDHTLYWDRVFDDILMSEGVITHYLPMKMDDHGERKEKGVDVLLALEAFEMTLHKKYDILVLIASDGDYVPLIRKLNTMNTRVMLLSWDFEYQDDSANRRFTTRTSQELLEEVSYPVAMHELIDNRLRRYDPLINNLFVQPDQRRPYSNRPTQQQAEPEEQHQPEKETYYQDAPKTTAKVEQPDPIFKAEEPEIDTIPPPQDVHNHHIQPNSILYDPEMEGKPQQSEVLSVKDGFGFIKFKPNNLFFHFSDVIGGEFSELYPGAIVEFILGYREDGRGFATNVRLL